MKKILQCVLLLAMAPPVAQADEIIGWCSPLPHIQLECTTNDFATRLGLLSSLPSSRDHRPRAQLTVFYPTYFTSSVRFNTMRRTVRSTGV
jgi:hypothetical protein